MRLFAKPVLTPAAITGLLLVMMPPAATSAEQLATLSHKRLPEASGMAVSRINEQRIWFINDSGNKDELVALDLKEKRYTRVKLKDAKNRDWEDLEGFSYQGKPWLAIADVGDNGAKRKKVHVYLLPEPDWDVTDAEDDDARKLKEKVFTRLELRYPDGPRDVESVAIDSQTLTLYLLSKRDPVPRLYRLELPELGERAEYELEVDYLGEVSSIPAPSEERVRQFPRHGKYGAQPTAMTLLPDGSAIAVMTYQGAYLAPLGPARNWLEALNSALCALDVPPLKQAESIAADSQRRIYVTSEGKKAPLLRTSAACSNSTER